MERGGGDMGDMGGGQGGRMEKFFTVPFRLTTVTHGW